MLTRDCLAEEAQTKVFGLNAEGYTNINDALLKAIELAGNTTSEKKLQKMIIFLTDGEPTEGEQDPKKIKVARDRIGEKPLYYGYVGNNFVFASELKAIKKFPNFENQKKKPAGT